MGKPAQEKRAPALGRREGSRLIGQGMASAGVNQTVEKGD